jgi:glycine/D-amino acid oxidase-like deaminating enzyme
VIKAEHVINAAGAWSPKLFQGVGLNIPVGVEPVYVVNWLDNLLTSHEPMPIIADYANRAYFRSWREGEIHMHQPRKRGVGETSTLFADNPLSIIGADFINNPINQMQGFSNIRLYEEIAHKRFKNLDNTVFSSGYQSYFDITPDLKFILGPDSKIDNLFHCLGSGQAFKYAPVFGEMMKEFIFGDGELSKVGESFSIKRFNTEYMKNFWDKVSGKNYSLSQENSSL